MRAVRSAVCWLLLIAFAVGGIHPGTTEATEIGVPLADPKFSISVFSREATRQKQGVYEVLTFNGGVRIYQGNFVHTADKVVIWIDRSQPESVYETQAFKYIVESRETARSDLATGNLSKINSGWGGYSVTTNWRREPMCGLNRKALLLT